MGEHLGPPVLPPAGADRRFYAFVLDRLLVWGVLGGVGWAAYVGMIRPGRTAAGLGVVAGAGAVAVVVVALALGAMVGLLRLTPGKAALGLRVTSADGPAAIGFGRGLLRVTLLGAATLPTLGFGAAALAWTALADPSGRRRGWHDRVARSEVVDARPPPEPGRRPAAAPRPVVNLTAMRLLPPSPTPPELIPQPAGVPRHPVGAGEAIDPEATTVTPRQQLGWPLVGGPPGPPPDRPPPRTRWRVAFDTGQSFVVTGLILVGRRPEPRPGEPVRYLVALPSDDMTLSKTHAQFQVVPDGALVVMDRGSTNGSFLVRAGATRPLPGGLPTTLRDGDRVRFGDREMSVAREA